MIARFDFNTQKDEQILVNTAISGVSMEGARSEEPAKVEVPENDFDKYLAETKANWNHQLGKVGNKGITRMIKLISTLLSITASM